MKARTMMYLENEQLRALRGEARSRRISLAELLRQVVQEHLEKGQQDVLPAPRATFLKIVGMGSSDRVDISEHHDAYLAEAIRREHAR